MNGFDQREAQKFTRMWDLKAFNHGCKVQEIVSLCILNIISYQVQVINNCLISETFQDQKSMDKIMVGLPNAQGLPFFDYVEIKINLVFQNRIFAYFYNLKFFPTFTDDGEKHSIKISNK
ncbi:unnamed protein product [Paramecium pentaurelia]|uniref:Uncharacterized protein n=1 Tax=Paramecium pentaurelia TaxID=43138 RepID=A0A8S1YN53_9CILI|nr:unnamed protein product [Paramecium pentaurelia]